MKNELRKLSIEKRKSLPIEEYSQIILNKLFSLDEYKKAKNILCYYPLKFEVQTQECLKDKSKNWFLPRVKGNELEVCSYNENSLQKGSFNIIEPTNSIVDIEVDLIIIPAVCADRSGYRIGYGKGYYDRFISSLNYNPFKVILLCDELLYEDIFPNDYDIKADIIVTNKEILKF